MYQPYNYGQNYGYMQPQKTEIIRVNGKNGGEMYAMAPNSEALLLDTSAPIVWLAQTDGAGYKTLTPYAITPYQPEPEIDIRTLNDRITKLEEILNDKSNITTVKKAKSEQRTTNGQCD